MAGGGRLLPQKRLRDIRKTVERMTFASDIAVRLQRKKTGEIVEIGGAWSRIEARYVGEITSTPKTIKLHEKQWEFLTYVLEAVENNKKKIPIQDIILHGARRSGKSVALAVAVIVWIVAKPGSRVLLIGLRKKHGMRITALLKKWLPPRTWFYDKREEMMMLQNGSRVWSRAVMDFDAERGDSLDILVLDEASFMRESVYEALAASVLDRNGLVIMASSPNKLNWFWRKAQKSESSKDEEKQAIRRVAMSFYDNAFLSDKVKKRAEQAAMTLSKDAYRQEILGEFISSSGLALPDFQKDIHVRSWLELGLDDDTRGLARFGFNRDASFFVGIDFNQDPTASAIVKFDKTGAAWVIDELLSSVGTEKFGMRLYDKLKQLGAEDPYKEAVLIADASGKWQGVGRNAPKKRASWSILKQQGWVVFGPAPSSKANPRRDDRLEITRALSMSAAGEVRLFVDPNASTVLQCFQELELKNGIPNLNSQFIHIWDGVTYALYRIWGTKTGKEYFGRNLVKMLGEAKNEDKHSNDEQ